MATDYYFKLFAKDYLTDGDIRRLPLEAQGLLIRMWSVCCLDGFLPGDLEEMALAVGAKPSQMRTHMQSLCGFFCVDASGNLISDRMERERQKRNKVSEGASKAAKAKWDKSKDKITNANADANAYAEGDASIVHSTYIPPKAPKGAKGRKSKNPESGELDRYPQEVHEAVSEWRGLLKALKDPDLQARFPADKRFLPVGVGTVEATFQAWEKHTTKTVKGHQVTNADVLEAIRTMKRTKLARAEAGESLSAKMLPSTINCPDFVDAVVHSVKARIKVDPNAA